MSSHVRLHGLVDPKRGFNVPGGRRSERWTHFFGGLNTLGGFDYWDQPRGQSCLVWCPSPPHRVSLSNQIPPKSRGVGPGSMLLAVRVVVVDEDHGCRPCWRW